MHYKVPWRSLALNLKASIMKTIQLLIATILISVCSLLHASPDSTRIKNIKTDTEALLKKQDAVISHLATISQTLTASAAQNAAAQNAAANTKAPNDSQCISCKNTCLEVSGWTSFLVFLPVIIFLVLLVGIYFSLRKLGLSLIDIISEKNSAGQVIRTPVTAGEGAATEPTRSTSRFIMFLAGILALIVGAVMTSWYMYFYMRTGCAPSLSGLTEPLIALGIAVIPYIVNKATSK